AGEGEWPPRFTKLWLTLDDGGQLAYVNKRRLGRLRMVLDPARQPPVSELGFDPLCSLPPWRSVAAQLARRRGQLKSVLLDQRFAAGVGNWMADEVLYAARLSPKRRACELGPLEVQRLVEGLATISAVAVEA